MAIFNIRLLQGGLIFLFSCMTLDVKVFWTLTSRRIFLNNDQFVAYVEHNIISNGPSSKSTSTQSRDTFMSKPWYKWKFMGLTCT